MLLFPLKPNFCCRYEDATYNRRNKNESVEIFERMNKYHTNINFTVEVNPSKFLDTKIHCDNNEVKYFTYHKEMKLPFY